MDDNIAVQQAIDDSTQQHKGFTKETIIEEEWYHPCV